MKRQLTWLDVVLWARFLDEARCQGCLLAGGELASNDVTAEDVQDDVQVEVGPLGMATECGDIPAPDLVRTCGEQFGLCVGWVAELVSSFADLVLLSQDAIFIVDGTYVGAFIKHGSQDLGRCPVDEAFGVQHIENGIAFVGVEGACVCRPLGYGFWWKQASIVRAPRGALAEGSSRLIRGFVRALAL